MTLLDRLSRATRPLAIVGCVSIGTVYVLVGTLALLALSGHWQGSADEKRMVYLLMESPVGLAVLVSITLGLAGYALWRALEVVTDPYVHGEEGTGWLHRATAAVSALGYGAIAFSIARILVSEGGGRETSEDTQQALVARVFDWPAGAWLVAAIGVLVVAAGVGQFVVLGRRSYRSDVRMDDASPQARRAVDALAWYGYASRGVILSILGYFLIVSATTRNAEAAGDTDTAFDFIGGGLIGDWAFFVVAVGTIAYGLFMYACAKYYRFGGR